MPEKKLTVSASPHVRSAQTVSGIMLNVIIALIPALAASIWLFGPRVLLVCLVTVGTCMLSEYLSRRIMKRSNTRRPERGCHRTSARVQSARIHSAVAGGYRLCCCDSRCKAALRRYRTELRQPRDNRKNHTHGFVPDCDDNVDKAPLVARQGRGGGHCGNALDYDDKGRRALRRAA